MTEFSRRQTLAGSAALAAGGLFGSRAMAQSPLAATLTFGPATAVYALGWIGAAKGFFGSEKLDLKFQPFNAGTQGRQAVAAGQAQFGHGDCNHPLQLSTRGKKCKIIMCTQGIASISNVVVRKDLYEAGITSIEKLAEYKRPDGTKPVIAATAIGAGTWMYGTYLFEQKKLADRMNWVAGGGSNTMYPSLQTKQFDAIMAVPTWVMEAEAQGFGKAIYDTSQAGLFEGVFGGTVPVLVVYALEEMINDNKPMVQAFVNGMVQTMKWVKSAPIDEVYKLVGEKYFQGVDPAAVKAELGFDAKTWAYDGRIDKAMWERGGRVWYRKGTDIPETKYEDIVDMSFLENALTKFK